MMLKALTVGLMLGLATAGTPETVAAQDRTARDRVSGGMTAFRSDTALRRFLTERAAPAYVLPPPPSPPPPPPPPSVSPGSPPPPPPTVALAEAMDSVVVTGNSVANPSITNNQVQGVDEGGIVKVSGQNLVILRRGRLFTVSTANGGLTPVDSIDAYPPGVDGSDDWYDEMLIAGDMIVVVGYSYGRGGTELNRFRVSPEGRLTFVDSHHLKSEDYYSDRNYASRLIGSQLVVYSPLSLEYDEDPLTALPGLSRWEPGQDEDQEPQWRRIVSARQVYAPQPLLASDDAGVDALHTVTRCDLAAVRLSCEATVVLGPRGRTFFVSQNAVYVWMGERWSGEASSMLIRMPLDGGRPGAVQVAGMPLDQFSFRPNAAASRLDILVTGSGGGDAMWSSNFASGDSPALLRLPTLRFGDGSSAAPASDYRALPGRERAYLDRDRFVGDHLFYTLRGPGDAHRLVVAPVDQGEPFILDAEHEIERIEQIGRDGLVIGGDTVTFTTIDLGGRSPAVGDVFSQPNTSQTESRSHAFFYRANPGSADGADGLLGLPTRREVPKGPDNLWASGSVTDVLFLRRQARRLSEFGSLDATPGVAEREDSCVASCVDWYGGARPIFLGNRVFALLGYELVEGDASGEAIREVRRADFIPRDGVSADGRTAAQNPPQ